MIIKYMWVTRRGNTRREYDVRTWQGWFLLGVIPIYIRCVGLKEVR